MTKTIHKQNYTPGDCTFFKVAKQMLFKILAEQPQSAYRGRYSRRTFHMRTVAWIRVMKCLRYSILFFTKTAINTSASKCPAHSSDKQYIKIIVYLTM